MVKNGERGGRKVSIRDVATAAGVSLATVSNALTGKDNLSDETRSRVLDVVKKLGYRASATARALRIQRTFTIGVLLADISNMSSPDFLRGMEEVADREQYSLLVCNTDGQPARQLQLMRMLLDRQVDGLLLLSQRSDLPEVRALFDDFPAYVLIQRHTKRYNDNFVGADNRDGIDQCIRHLVALGHRRVGFIRGPRESSTAAERLGAYRHFTAAYGLERQPGLVIQGDHQIGGGYGAAKRFFSMARPPTAIISSNDMCAMGVMNAAYEAGIRIPEDVSLIGMDDIALSSFGPINLTTIAIDRKKMGATAAELLLDIIRRKRRAPAKRIIFPMHLVVRTSTGPARTS